jgi:AraC-like DNA-binding protein
MVDRTVTMASHGHDRDQFTLAVKGSLQIETSRGTWTVPPGGAVWVPRGVEHAERLHAGASLYMLHLHPEHTGAVAAGCRTLVVSPLLRELVLRAAELGGLDASVAGHARLAAVLVDEIGSRKESALDLPAPQDPRALRLARLIDEDPADGASVGELARRVGTSRRTIERLFMAELAISVGEWRQRLRLHHAMRLLAERRPLADVARATGYGSANAFIAAFKRRFGVTPHRWGAGVLDPRSIHRAQSAGTGRPPAIDA